MPLLNRFTLILLTVISLLLVAIFIVAPHRNVYIRGMRKTTLAGPEAVQENAEPVPGEKLDAPALKPAENTDDKEHDELIEGTYRTLDAMARKSGSDKSSAFHDYMRVYAEYLPKLVSRPLKLLEIGIYRGASVRLWEEYFPNATLHFLDITDTNLKYNSTRSHFHYFSQDDKKKLMEMAESDGPYDIIIDDGSHMVQHVIASFEALFPYLRRGGMYVIGDLHTSYWLEYGGHGTLEKPKAGRGTAIDFLKNLIDHINFVGAATSHGGAKNVNGRSYYSKRVDSIRFYSSMCVIVKKVKLE